MRRLRQSPNSFTNSSAFRIVGGMREGATNSRTPKNWWLYCFYYMAAPTFGQFILSPLRKGYCDANHKSRRSRRAFGADIIPASKPLWRPNNVPSDGRDHQFSYAKLTAASSFNLLSTGSHAVIVKVEPARPCSRIDDLDAIGLQPDHRPRFVNPVTQPRVAKPDVLALWRRSSSVSPRTTALSPSYAAADIDAANFAAFDAAHPQAVGVYLTDRTNVLDCRQGLAASVGGPHVHRRGLLCGHAPAGRRLRLAIRPRRANFGRDTVDGRDGGSTLSASPASTPCLPKKMPACVSLTACVVRPRKFAIASTNCW
jgi:hypothetical protein